MSSDPEALIRLSHVEGIGSVKLRGLIAAFGSAEAVLSSPASALAVVPGVGRKLALRICEADSARARTSALRTLRRLEARGGILLTEDDPAYPQTFRELAEAPYLLYLLGNPDLLGRRCVAIVGTRYPTSYGREVARTLARDLALAGVCIVSGMARGIDGHAHAGALGAGGDTIGVLGHGIDRYYPPEAKALFTAVRERGLLISEFPPAETPRAGNFPRRNRLIAALSRTVVVVEMSHRSGAQHTVNFALEQGVDIMAVPGPITSENSAGTNQLLRDGAGVVTSAADVLAALDVSPDPPGSAEPSTGLAAAATPSASSHASAGVSAGIGTTPTHVDVIARTAGISVSDALRQLLILELQGEVVSEGGNRFRRAAR